MLVLIPKRREYVYISSDAVFIRYLMQLDKAFWDRKAHSMGTVVFEPALSME